MAPGVYGWHIVMGRRQKPHHLRYHGAVLLLVLLCSQNAGCSVGMPCCGLQAAPCPLLGDMSLDGRQQEEESQGPKRSCHQWACQQISFGCRARPPRPGWLIKPGLSLLLPRPPPASPQTLPKVLEEISLRALNPFRAVQHTMLPWSRWAPTLPPSFPM